MAWLLYTVYNTHLNCSQELPCASYAVATAVAGGGAVATAVAGGGAVVTAVAGGGAEASAWARACLTHANLPSGFCGSSCCLRCL
jgi:hypothetical protein